MLSRVHLRGVAAPSKPCAQSQPRSLAVARFQPSSRGSAEPHRAGAPHQQQQQQQQTLLDDFDAAVQEVLNTASRELGWLRQALHDPEDYTAAAVGRMVSKEYGRHERPHTDHHLWRTSTSSSAAARDEPDFAAQPSGPGFLRGTQDGGAAAPGPDAHRD